MNVQVSNLFPIRLGALFLALLATPRAGCAGTPLPPQAPSQTTNRTALRDTSALRVNSSSNVLAMTTEQVIERIRKKDWAIVEHAGIIVPDACPAIAALIEPNADPEIKELAVHALAQAGGHSARQGLIKALRDPHDLVRSAACR